MFGLNNRLVTTYDSIKDAGLRRLKILTLRFHWEITLKTSDYSYELPTERIAFYPLPTRDTSKLLVYKGGHIIHSAFGSLADHLPEDAFLFLNNTRVIPARLHFHKSTGGIIE